MGDARKVLPTLPSAIARACITSPPYWGLRDYGDPGQVGLEPLLSQYVEAIVAIAAEISRILTPDGSLWLNLGDCYINGDKGGYQPSRVAAEDSMQRSNLDSDFKGAPNRVPQPGLKSKALAGAPWRVALALQAEGWWLRSAVVWSKLNPMPESVIDRPTNSHEYFFLLTRSERYYYNAEAVREPLRSSPSDLKKMREEKPRIGGKTLIADDKLYAANRGTRIGRIRGVRPRPSRTQGAARVPRTESWDFFREGQALEGSGALAGRNRRSVWEIATVPSPWKHCAAMPPRLAEIGISASSEPGDLVLDPFAGSGTTGVAALGLDRRFLGIEINSKDARGAERRLAATPRQALLIP